MADQPKLRPLLGALERLRSHGLTTTVVVVAFHHLRVLPLMARRQRLFEMTPDEPIDGIRLSAVALFDEEILRRVREMMEGWLRSSGLTTFPMRPLWGYISLGMWDVRASPPPIPEDTERRAVNRAHAEAYKEWKDVEEARRKRKNLEHDKLEKRHWQQRHDGLPVELSPSPSLSDSSSDDDESEVGWGTLDHLPNIRGTALGASVSSPAFPGGGGEDASGPAIACPRGRGRHAQGMSVREARHQPGGLDGEGGAGGGRDDATTSAEGRGGARIRRGPAGTDGHGGRATTAAIAEDEGRSAEAVVSPFEKHLVEAPALAPRKALKLSTNSTAQWVVEVQAAIQRGAASARADPKEPVAQGEVTKAATKQVGEEAPMSCMAEAHESDEAKVPLVAEATEGEAEAPRTSEAEAMETRASRTTKAKVAEAGAPETTEAKVGEASVGAVESAAQEAEMEAGQASGPP
ncbi:uncharacterized protein [Miscanthus floridulus]|uniref:uncharacterized protein n=1 Tax=Miscanthus floridulus TaxID=154761 RepID=UPI00345A93C3